jgi:hypothetical protein
VLFHALAILTAQTPVPGTPYTRFAAPIAYTELPTPIILVSSGTSQSADITLPFPFRFYDRSITRITAGNAGCLAFQESAQITTNNQQPGSTNAFQNIDGWIAPWWDAGTMHAGQNAHLAYEVRGVAPNRVATFEWKRFNRNYSSSAMEWFNFQVHLFEGLSGRIEIDYGARDGTLPTSVSATMGMESPDSAMPILFAASACTTGCLVSDYDALAGTRITLLQDPGIELVALAVRAPEFATLGVPTPVPVILANLNGTTLGPFRVELSAIEEGVGAGTPVGDLELSLGPYQTHEIAVSMTAPIALGETSHYLRLIVDADGVIAEVDEQNNAITGADRVRFLPPKPDYAVRAVAAGAMSVPAGGQVTVSARIENAGSLPAAGEVALVLSTNTAVSPQDLELDRFPLSLDPGQVADVSRIVTIPAGASSGSYHVGALADPGGAIDEVSESNNGLAAFAALSVAGGELAILTSSLPGAIVQRTYVAILSAIGGTGVEWRVSAGALPAGIGLVGPTGELFGRAQTPGMYTFTVEASSMGEVDTRELELIVSDPDEPLTVVTRALPVAIVGQEYVFALRATGGAETGTLAWSAMDLPDGFALDRAGVLMGSATTTGTTTIDVSVTNGAETAMRSLTLVARANANLQLLGEELPAAAWNQPYAASIRASGGVEPISFFLEVGSLPGGLDLDTTGRITGTPAEVGRFRVVIRARDAGAGGSAATDVNTFELVVNDVPGFEIETTVLPEAVAGQGYRATVGADGGLPPHEWSVDGRLPGALLAQVDAATGDLLIVGTAGEPGVTNLLVSATDSQGRRAERALALIVRPVAVAPPPAEDDGCGCRSTGSSRAMLVPLHGLGLAWLLIALVLRTKAG